MNALANAVASTAESAVSPATSFRAATIKLALFALDHPHAAEGAGDARHWEWVSTQRLAQEAVALCTPDTPVDDPGYVLARYVVDHPRAAAGFGEERHNEWGRTWHLAKAAAQIGLDFPEGQAEEDVTAPLVLTDTQQAVMASIRNLGVKEIDHRGHYLHGVADTLAILNARRERQVARLTQQDAVSLTGRQADDPWGMSEQLLQIKSWIGTAVESLTDGGPGARDTAMRALSKASAGLGILSGAPTQHDIDTGPHALLGTRPSDYLPQSAEAAEEAVHDAQRP